MSKTGYMLFMAEPPMAGLGDHPATAPSSDIAPHDAESFASAYGLFETRGEAEAEASADQAAQLDAVEDEDLEDMDEPDVAMPVRIHDNGTLEVLADSPEGDVMASYTADEVYGAFGMTRPEPDEFSP